MRTSSWGPESRKETQHREGPVCRVQTFLMVLTLSSSAPGEVLPILSCPGQGNSVALYALPCSYFITLGEVWTIFCREGKGGLRRVTCP